MSNERTTMAKPTPIAQNAFGVSPIKHDVSAHVASVFMGTIEQVEICVNRHLSVVVGSINYVERIYWLL